MLDKFSGQVVCVRVQVRPGAGEALCKTIVKKRVLSLDDSRMVSTFGKSRLRWWSSVGVMQGRLFACEYKYDGKGRTYGLERSFSTGCAEEEIIL